MSEVEIWDLASRMLLNYSQEALVVADMLADDYRACGNAERSNMWKRVCAAIAALEGNAPNSAARVN